MKVSIIGSGTMGTGIAQILIQSESVEKLNVIARSIEKADSVKAACLKYLSKMVRKGKISESYASIAIEKLTTSDSLTLIQSSDLVIEAVAEDFGIKLDLYKKIVPYISGDMIVASNTSSLSITAFANLFPNPENIVGLHFFNPAPIMELVEIVSGHVTCESVINKLKAFTSNLGKSPVVVKEAPGFVVNRMLIPMINEAISILAEGIATAEDIDKAMKFGAHHPMGPLALADLIGNDVNLSIMETLHTETGDPKYRAHPLLRKMVRANHLGRKTKKGFFDY
jgi:3-hydroxybutyryl-CoA dehydrogenase